MKRRMLNPVLLCALSAVAVAALLYPEAGAKGERYHSPAALVLSAEGKTLYAADQTADQVAIIATATGKVEGTVTVRDPRGLALAADGKTLYVSSGVEDKVYRVDTAARKVTGSVATGRQPLGLVLSPGGQTLYCCNQFTDDVWVYDTGKLARKARLAAVREPRYAALGLGGKLLVVANLLPLGSNLDEGLGAEINLLDLTDGTKSVKVQLARGATDVGQVVCSADGRYAYVVHALARWLVPPTQLERGWIMTNALTVIDLQEKKRLNTVLLDDLDRGAANPWGLALSPDGATLYATHAGTHEVQIIDTAKLHKLIAQWPADAQTALEDDLTAVYRAGVRQRVSSGGEGPRAIVADGSGAYVGNYFSGTVTRVAPDGKLVATLPLGPQPPSDQARHGDALFHDARVCFQGWQSCASCHPDGRADGLAWDLMNDGLGNPKNAKSLLLSGKTPPVMAHGVRADMATAVASGYKYILFHVPTATELADTEAYVASLKPARSPKLNPDGTLSAAAKRGKAIFERPEVGCTSCHPAPLFTDLKSYDVGTKQSFDSQGEFDTPTLVELFRTAPYLHDGSAVTLGEVIGEHNKGDRHGKTWELSDKEKQDLVEYLLSL